MKNEAVNYLKIVSLQVIGIYRKYNNRSLANNIKYVYDEYLKLKHEAEPFFYEIKRIDKTISISSQTLCQTFIRLMDGTRDQPQTTF